jgi:hypothetical protein
MTKISVDKDELKTIRDKVDNLLEKGKQSHPLHFIYVQKSLIITLLVSLETDRILLIVVVSFNGN